VSGGRCSVPSALVRPPGSSLAGKYAHLVAPGLWEIIKSSLQTSTD
jgi:hypothetical protein